MKNSAIISCHIGPEISSEQFVTNHFFLYLQKGSMEIYDGQKTHKIKSGEALLISKNSLVRYHKQKVDGDFKKIVIVFDEHFLKKFIEKNSKYEKIELTNKKSVIKTNHNLIDNFANSLKPYYTNETELLDVVFADIKREELLLILLQIYPTLNNVYFNFGIPEKIDLEKFMIENFRFNVNLERFAFLTGRSLSTFKRDFIKIFGNKPRQWLTEKRLNEAYFLIKEKKQKPIDIYLNLGFENLSHFSFAFKKKFKKSPNDILNLNKL